jgi:hypothetical protein
MPTQTEVAIEETDEFAESGQPATAKRKMMTGR